MSEIVSSITATIRSLIGENSTTSKDTFVFNSSRIFSLSEDNIIDVNAVYKNDVELAESNNWSYSSTTNKVTLQNSVTLTAGDVLDFSYSYYPNYSDAEILAFIKNALVYIAINNIETYLYQDDDINPEPCDETQYLIAMIASILIRPENTSYRLPDVAIFAPRDSVSKDEMIRRVITVFKKNTHGIFEIIDINKLII